jgi:hypothetical protein
MAFSILACPRASPLDGNDAWNRIAFDFPLDREFDFAMYLVFPIRTRRDQPPVAVGAPDV